MEKKEKIPDAKEKRTYETLEQRKKGVLIRKAQFEDLLDIVSLYKSVVKGMQRAGIIQWDEEYPTREVFSGDIEKQNMYLYILREKLVGAVVLNLEPYSGYSLGDWKYPSDSYYVLHRLCVDPSVQGQGVATELMYFCEDILREKGISCVRLDTFSGNHPALLLYKKVGYEGVGVMAMRKGLYFLYEKKI